jgi:DNA-binding transcriptional regulator GbsR (MarR family)
MTDKNTSDVEEMEDRLREKDVKVLNLISEGEDDVQRLTSATTLSNSEVNYCFQKLEDMDLVTVSKPDGTVTRVIDGTKQVFEAPKQAQLTTSTEELVESLDDETGEQYVDLTRKELVRKVQQLEQELEEMKERAKVFRKQVKDRLREL